MVERKFQSLLLRLTLYFWTLLNSKNVLPPAVQFEKTVQQVWGPGAIQNNPAANYQITLWLSKVLKAWSHSSNDVRVWETKTKNQRLGLNSWEVWGLPALMINYLLINYFSWCFLLYIFSVRWCWSGFFFDWLAVLLLLLWFGFLSLPFFSFFFFLLLLSLEFSFPLTTQDFLFLQTSYHTS